MRSVFALLGALALLSQAGCGGSSSSSPTSPSGTTTNTSTQTSASHNAGRDCLSCHSFTAAGTVYGDDGVTPKPGVSIRITTAAAGSGTVVASLTSDASGNFYSNAPITFGTGLFANITNSAGNVRSMGAAITSGACNRCHTSSNRIVVQ